MYKYNSKTMWQSVDWQNLQNSLGHEAFFIEKNKEKVLLIKKFLPFGKSFIEIPRAKFTKNIWSEIKKIAHQQKAIFIRISYNEKNLPDFLQKENIKITNAHHFPELTLMIDLSLSIEDIFNQMKPQGRQHIRKAEKEKVEIIEVGNKENKEKNLNLQKKTIEEFKKSKALSEPFFEIGETKDLLDIKYVKAFEKILSETTKRQGFSGHNIYFYKKLLKLFNNDAFMLLAKHNNQIIAGGIFVYSGDTLIYLYGASSNNYRNLQAPTLLQWKAIEKGKERGQKYYDFLGIASENDKNHPWFGVSRFKRKFGGFETKYPVEVEIILSKFWFFIFCFFQKIIKFIKKLK